MESEERIQASCGTQQREGQPRPPERRAHLGAEKEHSGSRGRWMEGGKKEGVNGCADGQKPGNI